MRSSRLAFDSGEADEPSIAAALTRGGIEHDVTRGELQALLRGLADALPAAASDGASRATGMLSGDGLDDAVVQDGIAILGLERPILLPAVESMLRLMFLATPLAVGDGRRPIDTLFLILSPNDAGHAALRSKLTSLLDSAEFRDRLAGRMPAHELLAYVRERESTSTVATW
ncbi:MAG: hypothetical protein WBC44_05555 [Planctomycetaceae bacterium]